jgi:hypothetical protein
LRLVLAGVADPYTAQLVSDACGEQLVWRPQISENTSTSHQVERNGKTYTGGDSHTVAPVVPVAKPGTGEYFCKVGRAISLVGSETTVDNTGRVIK